MMKLSYKLMLRAAYRHQRANTLASCRNLHFCMCRPETTSYLPGRTFFSRFRERVLERCVSGTHNFQRHWESTSTTHELDMNKDLHCVQVKNSCFYLYNTWYEMDVNRSMPLSGVDFDVVYFDTKPRASSHTPVIVALHGTAGSHLNFSSLVPILMQSGARIIIPNFPGCGHTPLDKGKAFNHTDQERASFVMDFLNVLGVSRVDVLIVHSAGIYPALYCLEDTSLIRSIVLLNPAGHKPVKALQPVWFYQIVVQLLGNSLFRPLARLLTPMFASDMKLGFEQLEIAAKSLVFVNFEYVLQRLMDLKLRNIPMILSYAVNDKMVGGDVLDEMTKLFEFSSKEIVRYNADGHPVEPQTGKQRSSCIIFEDGGHFVMKAYPQIIGESILDVLELVKKQPVVVASIVR